MFIVSLNYTGSLAEIDRCLDAHVAFLQREYAEGNFVASGRKIPRTGGIILSCMANREALEEVIAKDPFFQTRLAEYDIIEFEPSMVAEGFEILKR